jgi:hypothetical protein
MPHINVKRRPSTGRPRATAVTGAVLLACLGLAACGGSTKTSSTSASAATKGATGSTGLRRPGGGRFRALRECLQKNGITLPNRVSGQQPGGPGGFLNRGAGAPPLPPGVTRAQSEAAVKKCGGAPFAGSGTQIRSPAVKGALAKFAACMRANGVNVPTPNTSGGGPIFNTKGLNTASPQFSAAMRKCRANLQGLFRRGPATGGPPGPP